MTELLLALIACLIAVIALRVMRSEPPTVNFYEDENSNAELARAILRLQTRSASELEITKLPDDIHKAMARVQSAAVDVQGFIDLFARYLVLQMPEAAYRDLDPPSAWMKKEDLDPRAD